MTTEYNNLKEILVNVEINQSAAPHRCYDRTRVVLMTLGVGWNKWKKKKLMT